MAVPASRSQRTAGSNGSSTAEGYLHELGVYASDDEFRALICPFALGGLEAGEPVVFAYDPYKVELLQSWLPDAPGIRYVTDASPYATPAKALAAWRKLVEGHLAAGAPRVRIAGNVPHPGYGCSYAGWDRYEAALDRAWGDLPVWAPCLYDARIAPADVLEAARRLHHNIIDSTDTQNVNDGYRPTSRLTDFLTPPPDPLELQAPDVELIDPSPADARAVISRFAPPLLGADRCGDLLLAASEAVTNAFVHGVPPVVVRIWLGGDRVVVNVHDQGGGPADPLAGLLPSAGLDASSGRGLWISHQLDIDVALIAAGEGFTVRLRGGG